MKKLFFSLTCICIVTLLFTFSASAESNTEFAPKLQALNLYVDEDDIAYNLDGAVTRLYAFVQLVYLLGAQNEALSQEFEHPFTDVPTWANSYVGYAYTNGITKGVSPTKFAPDGEVSEMQFLTLMLRAIGYNDAAGDFAWNDPFALAKTAGLIDSETPDSDFTRADAFEIVYRALTATMKDGGQLKDVLINKGVFTAKKYAEVSKMTDISADLDGDGVVNVKDVLVAIKAVLNGTALEGADMNGDGKLTLIDVIRVLKAATA